jgi:hypothetical protein
MVAGDTKKIVVIKDIPSDLVEEAILILRNETDDIRNEKNNKRPKDDFILKEAEAIIDRYIKENKLTLSPDRRRKYGVRLFGFKLTVNAVINIFMIAAAVSLVLAVLHICIF